MRCTYLYLTSADSPLPWFIDGYRIIWLEYHNFAVCSPIIQRFLPLAFSPFLGKFATHYEGYPIIENYKISWYGQGEQMKFWKCALFSKNIPMTSKPKGGTKSTFNLQNRIAIGLCFKSYWRPRARHLRLSITGRLTPKFYRSSSFYEKRR